MPLIYNGLEPLFSVIVTNYNYARYLAQCIESALSQDYPKVEIIVVDDGSQDHSRAVIESFGDRVKPVFKANGGTISSLNSGWRQAHGDMILILDADDFLLPGALSVHAKALSDDGVIRSQGYQSIVDESGHPTGRYYPSRRPQDSGLREIVLNFGPSGYFSTATSGNAWSRGFIDQVFPLPEKRTIGGDALLFDVAPMYGKTVTSETAVSSYRLHRESLQSSKASFTAQNISVVVEGYDFRAMRLQKTAESLGYKVQAARWRARNWRIATLRYLRGKLLGSPDVPRLVEHLATTNSCRHPAKRLAVLFAVLAMRTLPVPMSVGIASKMINLREM
jgi:glycosyltransferase involved in cell wall biosynthesis